MQTCSPRPLLPRVRQLPCSRVLLGQVVIVYLNALSAVAVKQTLLEADATAFQALKTSLGFSNAEVLLHIRQRGVDLLIALSL